MTTTKIYAPNAEFQGRVGAVGFVDGVATVDGDLNPGELRYFRRAGYGIGARPDDPQTVRQLVEGAPAKGAKVDDWRAYAVTQGATEDDAKAATKDELIERYGYGAIDPETGQIDARVAADGDVFGSRLRDAAVDPHPDDFLAPTNAGQANPHGPTVVSPEIHASGGPKGVRPGEVHVDDPAAQDAAETALAQSVLVEQEPHPAQPETDPETGETPDVDRGPLGLSDPGSAEIGRSGGAPAKTSSKASWVAYAIEQGGDADEVGALSRADLIGRYGPKASE